jgi:drug/metabolite transporter (DMT)-like permease
MKTKPSWRFFLYWLVACLLIDIPLEAFLHGHLAWTDLPGAIGGAILGAAVTWFFALLFWYKAQDRF